MPRRWWRPLLVMFIATVALLMVTPDAAHHETLTCKNEYTGEIWEYEVSDKGNIISRTLIKPLRDTQEPYVWAGARILVGGEIFRLLTTSTGD